MRDLARHQELQGVLGTDVLAEVDQALIHDLGARLGGDVAAKIDVELAGNLQVIGRPGIAHRVKEIDAAATCDRDERIGFGELALKLHRREVETGEGAYDLKVA